MWCRRRTNTGRAAQTVPGAGWESRPLSRPRWPHAVVIVGKCGYEKSFTLAALAEELARTRASDPRPNRRIHDAPEPADGTPIPVEVRKNQTFSAGVVDPRSWCALLGLSPESGAGTLLWDAAKKTSAVSRSRRRHHRPAPLAAHRRGSHRLRWGRRRCVAHSLDERPSTRGESGFGDPVTGFCANL